MSEVFHAKTKLIDIQDGEELIVVLNQQEAREYGINAMDKVSIFYKWEEIVLNVDLTNNLVKPGQVWFFKDVYKKYKIWDNHIVWISFTKNSSLSLDSLKKALQWIKLNYKEILAIMKDISTNRFTETLTTYFSSIWFFYKSTDEEMYMMAKAMAETWEMLKFKWIVADKHCMWWIPGNETTMIMIPLLASLWIKMPKTFSKSITTPAATWECVNVLMNISFSKKEIENLVKKENCCLVRGWWLDLAPADEQLIKVAYPLSMQSYSRTVISIMAKKYAMWINHSLVDIPIWPTAKVPDMKTANWLKKKYEYVGRRLWMKVHVEITKANQPIWAWVWPALQVREVLRVLQQHELRPIDLQNKAVYLCAKVIELIWMAKWKKAYELAYQQLKSGKAWKKMQQIIKAQWWKNPNIKSEELKLWKYKKEVKAEKDWKITAINLHLINSTTRTLWSPIDEQAWLYLHKKIWDKVKKTDIIYVMYANEEDKIKMALDNLKWKKMYEIK